MRLNRSRVALAFGATPRTARHERGISQEKLAEGLTPRLLRPQAAHAYLGMNKNNFNTLVRPHITVFRLGKRAIDFDLNTGLRDQELCGLKWSWEQRVPELDVPGNQRTVFVFPAVKNKNRQARVVVLNDRA